MVSNYFVQIIKKKKIFLKYYQKYNWLLKKKRDRNRREEKNKNWFWKTWIKANMNNWNISIKVEFNVDIILSLYWR